MKKKIILALVLVSAFVCLFVISASAVEVGGIYYSVSGSGETAYATVTSENRTNCTLETVEIPATIEVGGVTYKVTAIASNAFGIVNGDPNAYIKHLTIGANVTSVGEHAFRRITSLQTVKIENTNATSPISFSNGQFKDCTSLVSVEAKNAKIKEYGDYCFWSCSNLETVDFPPMLTRLGLNCFRDCVKLTTGDLSNTQVKEVAAWTFGSCTSLSSIKFPSTLTTIGNNVFLYCPVETYVFPHNVNSIAADTLAHQSKIKVLIMPAIDENHKINSGFLHSTRPNVVIYSGDNVEFFKSQFSAFSGYDVQPFENYVPGTTYKTNTIFYGAKKTCSICNGLYAREEEQFVFTDYTTNMKYGKLCSHCEKVATTKTVDAMIECLGWTAPEDDLAAASIRYKINKNSIAVYEKETGNKVEYGMYATIKDILDGNEILDAEGNAGSGAVKVSVPTDYVNLEIKLLGIGDDQKDTLFALGAYVKLTKEDETVEYSLVEYAKPKENDKYYFTSYNEIVGA